MNETVDPAESTSGTSRRRVLRTAAHAAWVVPAVSIATAAPALAASTTQPLAANLAWTANATNLAQLNVLGGGTVASASVLPTMPDQFTLFVTSGQLPSTSATVTIEVDPPTGLNLSLGTARGFGVYSFNGVTQTTASNKVTYSKTILGTNNGFPTTVWTGSLTVNQSGNTVVPVTFGLDGTSSGLTIGVLSTFTVKLTVAIAGGATYTATTTISVPAGVSLL